MLKTDNTKSLPGQFFLTPEQKTALIEGKIKRAEASVKVLAEIAKQLERKQK
jgi:hypothetical protein